MAFIIWLRKESDNIVKSSIHCGAPYVTGAAWKFTKMTFSFQITYTSWSISSILVILHSVGPIYGHDKESATIMLMAEVNKQTTMKISKMLHLAKNLLWCVMGVFAWLEHNHSPPPKTGSIDECWGVILCALKVRAHRGEVWLWNKNLKIASFCWEKWHTRGMDVQRISHGRVEMSPKCNKQVTRKQPVNKIISYFYQLI
jgi:hypothetical protein